MEERRPAVSAAEGPGLSEYLAILRANFWKMALLTLAICAVSLVVLFRLPDRYRAAATITPASDEEKKVPSLGSFAYSLGLTVGGPTKIEDLEALFKSRDLTVRVFAKHNFWGIVLPKDFDKTTGKIKNNWLNRLLFKKPDYASPSDWDAIRVTQDKWKVTVNRRLGTLTLSYDSPLPEGSAELVESYLEEAKSRLQEEALERANKNKRFIEEQISPTVDALTRDRLYSLYGQEVEREMMARNREQFGFRVLDSPRVPDRKVGPSRGTILVLIMFFSLIFSGLAFLLRGILRWRKLA